MTRSRHNFLLESLEPRTLLSASVNTAPLDWMARDLSGGFLPAVPVLRVTGPYEPVPQASVGADRLSPTGALIGDANADGAVNALDFAILDANFGKPGSWYQGDTNGDRKINFADFVATSNNLGHVQSANVYDNRMLLSADGFTEVYYAGPTDSGPTYMPTAPVINIVPRTTDALQSHGADCWLIGSNISLVLTPGAIESHIQPDAGGGVVVTLDHYRVHESLMLPTWADKAGASWSYLIEKAYTGYRNSFTKDTYASCDYGNPVEVFWAFGMQHTKYLTSYSQTQQQIFDSVTAALAAHEPVVALTNASGTPNLVANHAYAVVKTHVDSTGTMFLTLQNPWGFDPGGYGDISMPKFVTNVTFTEIGE